MSLMKLSSYRRFTSSVLLILLFSLLVDIPVVARMQSTAEARGSNVRWKMKDELIYVTYDLQGSPDEKYHVSITMKQEKDSSFSVQPATVEGDIGDDQIEGTDREIRWYFRQDYPQGFHGEGYYFEILVTPIQKKSNLLYCIVGGTALAVGIVALLIGSSSTESPTPSYFPSPPARP